MTQDAPSVRASASWLGAGLLLVLATAILSGISTFVNLYAVSGTNSAAFVTARNSVVALMLVPIAAIGLLGSARPAMRRTDWLRLAAIGIVGGGIPFLLFFRGLELASASGGGVTASFVYRTLFLMASVLGLAFLHERFHWRVAIAGVLLLGGNLLLLSLTTPIWTPGTLYVFAATVLWAIEYTISKRALADLPSGTVALGRMGIGSVFLFAYLAATAQVTAVGSLTGGQWAWVGVSSLLLTGFVATWYTGLKRTDLGVATAVLVLGFPITWLLSVSIHGLPVTTFALLGALTVAAGVGVAIGRSGLHATWEYLRGPAPPRPDS